MPTASSSGDEPLARSHEDTKKKGGCRGRAELIVERPGALDVHTASVMACVRVWHRRELEEHLAECILAHIDYLDEASSSAKGSWNP